ncbi:MAG: protein-glutamate O-methyltransferase CheR [Chloroflexi bacterium]|nr:protein-glutamate O-methyltransferase CheR [Chloroflexota bacterium]
MKRTDIENLETKLLLDAIYKRYGYDFSHYATASLKRRIEHFLNESNHDKITETIPRLLYDEVFFEELIQTLSITVTEMFRDPFVYRAIRGKIIPTLKDLPFLKIWHAGCATGEEVYSMAILLKEAGIFKNFHIYATDFNNHALERAREGIYPLKNARISTVNYQKSDGETSFSDYYQSKYDSVIMNRDLKKNITFANHNLVTDSVFGEMNFIICRNVMIYFDKILQERVFHLFNDSLSIGGFLCIGSKESLQFSEVYDNFEEVARKERIYRKIR